MFNNLSDLARIYRPSHVSKPVGISDLPKTQYDDLTIAGYLQSYEHLYKVYALVEDERKENIRETLSDMLIFCKELAVLKLKLEASPSAEALKL